MLNRVCVCTRMRFLPSTEPKLLKICAHTPSRSQWGEKLTDQVVRPTSIYPSQLWGLCLSRIFTPYAGGNNSETTRSLMNTLLIIRHIRDIIMLSAEPWTSFPPAESEKMNMWHLNTLLDGPTVPICCINDGEGGGEGRKDLLMLDNGDLFKKEEPYIKKIL